MSFSRSRIAVVDEEGIRSIICEKDGTVDKVGKLLQLHYNCEKLNSVIEHGDVFRLGIDASDAEHHYKPAHANEFPLETIFFCRDLNAIRSRHKKHKTFQDFINSCDKDYAKNYFVCWRDSWFYGTTDHKSPFYKKLTSLVSLIKF